MLACAPCRVGPRQWVCRTAVRHQLFKLWVLQGVRRLLPGAERSTSACGSCALCRAVSLIPPHLLGVEGSDTKPRPDSCSSLMHRICQGQSIKFILLQERNHEMWYHVVSQCLEISEHYMNRGATLRKAQRGQVTPGPKLAFAAALTRLQGPIVGGNYLYYCGVSLL